MTGPTDYGQYNLFENVLPSSLGLEEAGKKLGVSTATIRNWLKTGYLKSAGRGRFEIQSLAGFQADILGKAKLTQRANKSLKDSHNHNELQEYIINECLQGERCVDKLAQEYEEALSNAYRNKEGVYYTPVDVASDLLRSSLLANQMSTFCDPCCGSGNFVIRALDLGIRPENIYAYDVDPVAVELTKSRLYRRTGFESPNIRSLDFLEYALNAPLMFDCIFTNPPWGKKISRETRMSLGEKYGAGSSIDTCALFFFACLKCLNNDGTLGLLLPEAFFNIAAFEDARKKALSLSIIRLIEYGRVFNGLLTKAQGIVIEKKSAEKTSVIECCNAEIAFIRDKKSFESNPKSILNLNCDEHDSEILSYLFSLPHVTLEEQADWGLGIVTGNNKKFIRNKNDDNCIPVFRGSDLIEGIFRKPSNFIPKDLSLYQQVAPVTLYLAKKKLIYKFISSKLSFAYDDQQRYVLNSANIVIPHDTFPVPMKLMAQLLNSDFMNWIFNRVFCTHKVLRKDIERLPIYSQKLENMVEFDEEAYLDSLSLVKIKDGTYRIKR
ncbi:N-6 DNA methylase [Synechococcus sp. CS-1330]|nr:N-6 DNA methylase [Synechococcus sp. CS-1330]